MPSGYYRHPTIYENNVVFVCEDDLWTVPATGGIPRRLTSNLGQVSRPALSPDGTQLAFVGREEGQVEVYIMPAIGGAAKRLTFMGGDLCLIAGWTKDHRIIFANNAEHWYLRFTYLYTVDTLGNVPTRLNLGMARAISYGPNGGVVIGRHTDDPARWKRYRGGTVGQLWIDLNGDGDFQPLLPDLGNLTSPMWIGAPGSQGRIYFISDHEAFGNLYSCLPSGGDLRRHTDHEGFYARNASTDGKRIVYHAGADLYLYDPGTEGTTIIPIEHHSPQVQRNRKFVNAARYLNDWTLHPQGQITAITSRGKLFTFANWEGAVIQHGVSERRSQDDEATMATRYRLPRWLHDGKRLIAVTDEGGEETFIIFHTNSNGNIESELLPPLDIGRPQALAANPKKNQIVFSNNRYELLFLDLDTHELRLIDRGKAARIAGFDWSPDGEWLAYSVSISLEVSILKLWHVTSGEITPLTQPLLRDVAPAFDPQGKYLYFLSYRAFEPVYDNLHFDLNFPRGMKPYLITLQKDLTSPFIPKPMIEGEEEKENQDDENAYEEERGEEEHKESARDEVPEVTKEAGDQREEDVKPFRIDVEGIEMRVIAFPVPEGRYGRVLATNNGKILYSRYPAASALRKPSPTGIPEANGTLLTYNFQEEKEETLISGITSFALSADGKTLIYRAGNRLRILKAGEKPDNSKTTPSRTTGWLNLSRIKVLVVPGAEWRQMYREAWRLQRDQFWTADMSQVDWLAIYDRYLPLVDRVSSRSEFSDLMWEMQGELGTSHAYEFGGDYRPEPRYSLGYLGADFDYDPEKQGWRITHIYQGDAWDPEADSPLNKPGVNVEVGDCLVAVNGRKLSHSLTPAMTLVNLAGDEITLTFVPATEEPAEDDSSNNSTHTISVKTISSEMGVRYREWVEANRQRVHQATDGKVGYVHIPDMGAWGYAEFHRGYLSEVDREGLIVDVRFNRGGHVSALILEKLARQRIGYDVSRWSQLPMPYPLQSVAGPIVALTNENAGSDGDIFSHGFKLLKLGPLIGKRTWGGVIGIEPHHTLVDGTLTTQPEYSFWFSDVGWNVENYGTDPDIEVDIRPQDYAMGVDAQLESAIEEIQKLLDANPPELPDFSGKPSRTAPKLPDRSLDHGA